MSRQEDFSVSLVRDFCGSSEYMDSSDISYNDKTISWDGNIVFFKNKKPQKTGDEHKVPVQIKGQGVDKIPNSQYFKKQCEISDLKNYYKNGGVIFIVVIFDKSDTSGRPQKEMYASILLPANIKPLIEGNPNQKKVSLMLEKIENSQELEALCRLYIDNWSKQSILLNTPDTDEFDFHELKISFLKTKNSKTPAEFGFIESNNVYLYGVHNGVEIPLIFEPNSLLISRELTWDFQGENINVVYTTRKNEISLTIQSFIGIKNLIAEKKLNVSIKSCKSLRFDTTFLGAKFILAMVENETVKINNKNLPTMKVFFNLDEKRKKYYKYILELGGILDKLDIAKNIFYTNVILDNADIIKMLYDLLINRKRIPLDNNSMDVGLHLYEIGDLKILLEYRKCDDGHYEFYDYFKEKETNILKPVLRTDNNERLETSRWFLIQPNDLPNMIINRTQMSDELEIVTHQEEIGMINEYVLALVNSYDRSGKKEDLSFAFNLLQIIMDKEIDKPYVQINLLQIKKRMGTFDDNDRKLAIKLKTDSLLINNVNIASTCCACILLEQFDEFQTYFNQLSEEEQRIFCSWPIYALFKRNK